MTKDDRPLYAPLADDEGEPQTVFMPPQSGGRYIRNPDGSLTRVEPQPTE